MSQIMLINNKEQIYQQDMEIEVESSIRNMLTR